MKTGDVVLVVLHRVERDGQREIRETGMDATLLVDWHLVFFEVEVGDTLLEDTNQEIVGELVLVGKPIVGMASSRARKAWLVLCRCIMASSE